MVDFKSKLGTLHPCKPLDRQRFSGFGDAYVDASIQHFEAGVDDDPAVVITLQMAWGNFEVSVEKKLVSPLYPPNTKITIMARDHADGEIPMLAQSLRWLADRLAGEEETAR